MQTSDKNLKIVFREYKEGDEAEIINIINEAYDKKVIELHGEFACTNKMLGLL